MAEITALLERLQGSAHFSRGRHRLLPLHSAISPAQQRAAFEVNRGVFFILCLGDKLAHQKSDMARVFECM
jgi:hypothetical protein